MESTLETSPANEVQRIRSIGNGQKKTCAGFSDTWNVAGFWLMLHMSKWKALGMFDLFLWIYVH